MGWLRTRSFVVGLCALAVGGIYLYRAESGRARDLADPVGQAVRLGQDAWREVSVQPLEAVGTLDGALGVLSAMDVRGEPCEPRLTEALRREVAEFLVHRFGAGGCAAYIAWRQSGGDRLRSITEMEKKWLISDDYQLTFNAPLRPDEDAIRVFEQFWASNFTVRSGSTKPTQLASDGGGLVMVVGTLRDARGDYPPIAGKYGMPLWHGKVAGTNRAWFEPARSIKELLAAQGSVRCASVGLIAQVQDGSRRPWILTYVLDTAREKWMLTSFCQNNYHRDQITVIDY